MRPWQEYDANGNLTVLEGPKRMVYIGGIFEKNLDTGEVTKYYHTADGRRLAMRKGSTLSYFANDHLGGTAVVMNDAGGLVSRCPLLSVRKYVDARDGRATDGPAVHWPAAVRGEVRHLPLRRALLQRRHRAVSAARQIIVPEPGDPQALNRYSYVLNNPILNTRPDRLLCAR